MGVVGKLYVRPRFVHVVGIIVVAVQAVAVLILADCASTANAQDVDQRPIGQKETSTRENSNSINRELFKRLFVKRRKEHLEAVKNLRKMNNYERQYKMINVLAEKMFDVIESKKAVLEKLSESELRNVSFGIDAKNDVRDAVSSVLENAALFGDVVLNLPDITQRILKTRPKWNATMRWSFDFLNRTKDLLDKSTLDMLELARQELGIGGKSPDYFNPNRSRAASRGSKEPTASKKEKRKKGPRMTRIEL